ncbi:phosphoribosylglycinamide formyltransferase [uncultured Acetobacteroides sp.]|uniref:phosphoribosylglycinamide formyltransferase n=1 Tax=uncultured Acetobacteroides sp. TaxID=1760811 RepID=UPI0029F4B479|nr:phosphoribosylglycinamide formyltransferase [uncultured Acetobacteroides sp.]
MKKIAVLASGSGSNAENLVKYFRKGDLARVSVILSNKKDAFALERAHRLGVPSLYFGRDDFYNSSKILETLKEQEIDCIVLAGFLWLVPDDIIEYFSERIVNIHPALLPKYGGKGMFGMKVHAAVVENGEHETGITIHYVNSNYDEGSIIFQAKTEVLPTDSPEMVAEKIHALEYEHFPRIVEKIVASL